jgi:hypothetical protein
LSFTNFLAGVNRVVTCCCTGARTKLLLNCSSGEGRIKKGGDMALAVFSLSSDT